MVSVSDNQENSYVCIMEQTAIPSLKLESLADGIPVIFGGGHHWLIQKCVFSLDKQGHASGVILHVVQ